MQAGVGERERALARLSSRHGPDPLARRAEPPAADVSLSAMRPGGSRAIQGLPRRGESWHVGWRLFNAEMTYVSWCGHRQEIVRVPLAELGEAR